MRVAKTIRADQARAERGAVLPFIAIMAVVIFGVGALAVDLGNGWATRRSLITATDAGARAAAQEFATGGNGCSSIADQYVQLNVDDATNIVCEPNLGAQYVTVDADANVETWFAGVLGFGDFDTTSSSTVRWGQAISLKGLRPIALCSFAEGIGEWVNNPSADTPPIQVPFFNKAGQPEECNGDGQGQNVEGNWGVLDFDGNGGQTVKDMVENGYGGTVTKGDPAYSCLDDPLPNTCYSGEPGNITQIKQKLQALVGVEIILPIVNYVTDGTGANVQFHVIGFAAVTITELNLEGPAADRWIEIQFNTLLDGESCCSATSGPSNVQVIQACAVDRRDLGSCS